MAVGMISPLPRLDELYIRHQGLTESLCRAYAEAASVCLLRHHLPPTQFNIEVNGSAAVRLLQWTVPDDRAKRAWNNTDDATRDGAYSLSLAAIEAELGYVAVRRAETRTGADYYLGTSSTSLEEAYRLEVSGVDRGDVPAVARRLREKVQQARLGISNLLAIASVVGFLVRHVGVESVRGS